MSIRRLQPGRSTPVLSSVLLLLLVAQVPAVAQARAPAVGTVQVGLLLKQLDGEKRVLMIGAHPDDEDTSMLATLARGQGAQTAYLSLSRGEGGQNLIGPELRERLGLLRTGELVAARGIDGGQQFFSRAFDFGFSKSAEEAFQHWPEEELVRDVTWVIRTFRPHVILSVFTGTPRDGHGQHQVAGIAARRAFDVSGDPSYFPDQLELGVEAWTVSKIYQLNRFGRGPSSVTVQTGTLDPLLGRSYYQLAMESRSQHRSQDMGSAQSPGPRTSGGSLLTSRLPGNLQEEDSFFTEVDTTLTGIASAAGGPNELELISSIARYREAVTIAGELLHPTDPSRALAALQDAANELRGALSQAYAAPAGPGRTELVDVLESRETTLTGALLAASGVVVDVRVDQDWIVAGDGFEAEVIVWNGGSRTISVSDVGLLLPEGWDPPADSSTEVSLGPGEIRQWRFSGEAPLSALVSRPYFLEQARDGALYRWPSDASVMARPGNPPLIAGRADVTIDGGVPLTVLWAGSHVAVDQADGEYRAPVFVVPRVSVAVGRRSIGWPSSETRARSVAVRASNLSQTVVEGEVILTAPAGWEVSPESYPVSLAAGGGDASVSFQVRPRQDVPDGVASFGAVVRSDGGEYREGVALIDYPHVDPVPFFQAAELVVSRFPVQILGDLRVGYVMGSGDEGPQALTDLGVDVELLGPEEVRAVDLDRFDTVVLGIRAYETRADLRSSNERLLEFARRGGTVISQYNQYQYPAGGFAPFPVEIARPHGRVTDEGAVVGFLEVDHPLVSNPNGLSTRDFEGWVQERGLYFLSRWDEAYTPLLEMADPGAKPERGSLLVTRLGEGAYVYTGLALFRQFPAGVPGAFRILANLVSLRGSDLTPIL